MKKDLLKYSIKLSKIFRSITGKGTKEVLKLIKEDIQSLKIKSVKSGFKAYDWTVPLEWNVKEAFILDENKNKIINFKNNYLHLVSYSIPINKTMKLKELNKNLFSLPKMPNAIPYVTSYYKKMWGFCLTHKQRMKLKNQNYKIKIDTSLKKGDLFYGELLIKGKSKKEIFISTYICHPTMANNENSGPAVTKFLCQWIKNLKNRYYSYRIIFVPETIGSIVYLKKNLIKMKKNIIAGFNINCVGDNRSYSFLPSRNGNTISDEVAKHVLKWTDKKFKKYSWNERGSDERQYCSPGVDLPVVSLMRSKFGEYPEYHTSLDNFEKVVSSEGLLGGYNINKKAIEILENNHYPISTNLCEPKLDKYNLYGPQKESKYKNQHKYNSSLTDPLYNLLSHCDGKTSLMEIADKILVPVWELYPIIKNLKDLKLIKIKNYWS